MCETEHLDKMLLTESSTSQSAGTHEDNKISLKMEEVQPWKLSEEEEGKGSPPLTDNIMVYVDREGRSWVGRKRKKGGGSAESEHSPCMSSQQAGSQCGRPRSSE